MKLLAYTAAAMMVAGAASAATVTQTASIPLQSTDWGPIALSFNDFDASLGTLDSVTITLGGLVSGTAAAESQDGSDTLVTLNLGAEIESTVVGFGTSLDVTINPVNSQTVGLSSFDGLINFDGPSGFSSGTVTATDSASSTETTGLGAFIGDGTGLISIEVDAAGQSAGTGSGNLLTQFITDAEADVTVVYEYTTTAVPLPAAAWLLIGGIGGLAALRRRAA